MISCYFFYDHFNQNKLKFLGAVTVTSCESKNWGNISERLRTISDQPLGINVKKHKIFKFQVKIIKYHKVH